MRRLSLNGTLLDNTTLVSPFGIHGPAWLAGCAGGGPKPTTVRREAHSNMASGAGLHMHHTSLYGV